MFWKWVQLNLMVSGARFYAVSTKYWVSSNCRNFENTTVRDNDGSGEREIYRLIRVAPAAAVQGGAATTYSANIANGVPVYSELDDDNTVGLTRFISSQPNFYSAQGWLKS